MGRRMGIAGALVTSALIIGSTAHAQDPQLDPNGWIVFEHFGQAPDGSTPEFDFDLRQIWLVHPDGSDLHELAPRTPVHGKASPDVSPDGTRVAFNTWRPLSQVWEVGLDGEGLRLVSEDCSGRDGDCQEWDPAYSADGERVAFVHVGWEDGAGFTEIGIRELAGGPPTYLTSTRVPLEDGDLAQPSWSPDGTRIAYHRNTGWADRPDGSSYPSSIRIWIVAADGSDLRELATPEGGDAADPDWSPDGSRIVYSTVGYRESEGVGGLPAYVNTIRPDGTDLQALTTGWAPTWMPDGEHILFWGDRTWSLMGADGANEHQIDRAHLTWFADGLGFGYFATWAPGQ